MNKVELVGRLTAEPELRYTESDKAYTRFTLAVNRKYKKDDETFIIDAKMYQYGATHDIKDLPQTESMQKQITYGDYVYNVLGDKKVRNVFILPYDKNNEKFVNDPNLEKISDENLVYIGKAFVDWRSNEEHHDHDFIYTFMIDLNYLLKNYLLEKEKYISSIINFILELFEK